MTLYCRFLIVLLSVSSFSQTIVGTVVSYDTKSNIEANILIKNGNNLESISEYTFSTNGKFQISLKKDYQKIILVINAYGYEEIIYTLDSPIKTKTYTLNFTLKTRNTELEEVIVKAKRKFTIKKDTVNYNVEAYSDGSERKIQDVINKIPGIEVNINTGEIKYRGKSVETVLLEGDNLFDYNYSLGTKNINVDMVEEIQAIENYSENPLLKGIENGDKVALNLKLKKGKVDFSGNIDLGIGIFEKEEQALSINSNVLGITANYKSYATLAYNNIGVNNSTFDYFGFNANIEQQKEEEYFAQKIIPEIRFSSVLEDEKANINNQYFGNYNAIFKINERLKVKTNLYYINDKITSEQLFENQYEIQEESFVTIDSLNINKKPKQYRGDLEVKYNSSKTSLIEYNLRVNQEEIKTRSSIFSNNSNSFNSYLKSENYYLKQKLLFTIKQSENKAIQFTLHQSINKIPQIFQINPSVFGSEFSDNIQNSNFEKNYLEGRATILGSSAKSNKYAFSVGGIFDKNEIQSELFNKNNIEIISVNNSINDLEYRKKNIYHLGAYHFNINKWRFSTAYSISYLNQIINDKENSIKNTKTDFIIEPSLNIKYRLNNISSLTLKAGYNKKPNSEKYLFLNQILISNRMSKSNTPSLELQKTLNYDLFYFNNDLYNQLQIKFGLNYNIGKGNFFMNSLINERTTHIKYFYLPQEKSNLNISFLTAKYIPFLESTIKLSSNYSISKYKNIVNNSELRNNLSEFLNTKLFVKTAFDGIINFENSIDYSKSISKNEDSNQFLNESVNNEFTIILKPLNRWFILLSSEYFLPNKDKKSQNYQFIDASIRYRPKNERIEFNFVAKNLLNENSFEEIQTSDFSTNIFRTNILPRYYLLNMTYNF